MADFPYTPHPATLKKFFAHIQSAGVPEKVSIKYLETVGFKTKNDRYIIGVLKFLGFVDSNGIPTELWSQYRNRSNAMTALAGAIQSKYNDLFQTYPDAYRKDNEALRNYFSPHTTVAESTLGLIVSTFKVLCELANFEGVESIQHKGTGGKPSGGQPPLPPQLPVVNINIQLQLPATDDATIYDKLFAALKKHLLS